MINPLKQSKQRALNGKTFFKKVLAHRKMMCYLIADEGSACPTSNSKTEMDRAALLFFCKLNERTKDNGNLYVEKQPESPQNVQPENVGFHMRF